MPSLIVPRGYATGKPNRRAVSNPFAQILRRRKSPDQKRYVGPVWKGVGPQPNTHPGRKYGNTVASWIDDLTALRKVIALCELCQSGFYYKRAKYYKDERFGPRAFSECDGCRQYSTRAQLYIPEENLIDSDGFIRPGQCWAPK